MDGNANNLASSTSRPVRLHMRPDLVVQRATYQGRAYWVVKDPIAQKYYRFEEEEHALLEMLDGQSSLDQIRRRFERRFAPQQITAEEIHRFIGMLYRSSLLVSETAGQGVQLRKLHDANARRRLIGKFTNVLAIRFKGFDPDRLLNWLGRWAGWLFSPLAALAVLGLALAALLLITVQFDTFRDRLPAFHEFFGAQNWIWIFATICITKVLHELGHGLACKRFGGECHEMGVMFLVLTPCLYCNVSDSWMLPSKWRRMAIGAAGMYIEFALASMCTFLWWFSEPGMLNYLCLNVMFVCSVSTLLFNANPLLRFDGYYILSDLIEVPNLRQKASSILRRKLGAIVLGLAETPDPFLPKRRVWFFALYSVAAAVYRWLVLFSILWFLNKVFEPYGLQILGQLIACVALYGLVVMPVWQLIRFLHVPGRLAKVKKKRVLACAAVATALVCGICFIPLPHYVSGTMHVQPRGASAVYVEVSGNLAAIHRQPNRRVEAGQPIITLDNIDIRLTIDRLEGQRQLEVVHLANLQQRALTDDAAATGIAQVEQSIAALEKQIERRRRDLSQLQIVAPASGTLIPPPIVNAGLNSTDRLQSWTGTPLDKTNVGAFLTNGVLVCQVGDPSRLEAVLLVDQTDVEFVREGQRVEIFFDQYPGRQFDSKVGRISQIDMKTSPRRLSAKAGGDLATTTDVDGRERPLNATYQVSASLDSPGGQIINGATGRAKIHVGYQTLGSRMWRYFCQTFKFEL